MSLKIDEIFGFDPKTNIKIPLYVSKIKAGFPSPADDYIDKKLDLNEYLIKHPSATFFVRVEGESMIDAGIQSGDILVVDRAEKIANNKIVIAALNGELTVKRIQKNKDKVYLIPENSDFAPIEITPEMDFFVWGIVTWVLHKV